MLKEGDLLQLGRDSPTDKQILGKIKLFYPHEDSSLIPSSCAVLGDTEDIQESSLEKTASFESLIEQLRKIEKRTPYEEDRFQRLQHADDHMKLFGSDIKEAVYFSGLAKIFFSLLLPFLMLKNAFKKYPPQNRTNVQIKGGGGQRPFEQCSKKLHFFEMRASLIRCPVGVSVGGCGARA